jgi:dihydroflavonol-4-reductase
VKVFVTGATGFVGSHLVRLLLQEGHQVRILRRQKSSLAALEGLDVEHIVGELDDEAALTRQLSGIDWVFHVAAVADYWRNGKEAIYRANVDGTAALLRASEKAGVGRFIFTSSVAAIGHRAYGITADETTYFNVDPNLSPYGHSKFLAEAEVLRAVKRGLDGVIVNPSVILGPGDINQISGSLILEIARGNLPVMSQQGGTNFIDVRDVAAAHLAAAEKGRRGERYILGAVNMTHKAFTRLVCKVIGVRPPIIPAPGFAVPAAATLVDLGRSLGLQIPAEGNQLRLSRMDIYVNTRKMNSELYQPQIDIQQSIQDTYDWYRGARII